MLIGRATLNEVMQPWGPTARMAVLAAGSIPPKPSEMLASDAMRATLSQLARHSIVLVDAPPLLPVTDVAILTARTDGAIDVTYAGRTRVDAPAHFATRAPGVAGASLRRARVPQRSYSGGPPLLSR